MKNLFMFICILFAANQIFIGTSEAAERIKIIIGGTEVTAVLYDNPTARDFASLLPLTLNFSDYAASEKIANLPREISTGGAPTGYDPALGDIALYAPWGNIAVYYKDQGYAAGLVPIAKIEGNGAAEFAERNGNFSAVISPASPAPEPAVQGDSGGGCSAGLSSMALLFGVPLVQKRGA